jgi:hypothetical protein
MTTTTSGFLNFDNLEVRYEPYPIALAAPVIEEGLYGRMLDNFPRPELFAHIEEFGSKYSLSEKFSAEAYRRIVAENPLWREFHAWIKSPDFVEMVLDALKRRHIEVPIDPRASIYKQARRAVKSLTRRGHIRLARKIESRFEFSMLPADGGNVLPHTDSPGKIITIVVSMARPGEWNPAFGGGTDVNRARDPQLQFNQVNRQARFEDMEILHTYEFRPNQAILFIKTFNSWHSVRPMTGKGSGLMRRTLTINIEEF